MARQAIRRTRAGIAQPICGKKSGQRESWLEILGRYLVAEKDKKKQIRKIIFPRYHQLDATRKLLASGAARRAPAAKYLIQHSAGSGKTNSIAWSAHFLADLHDAQHKKVFDSVLVVSDRNVIDQQLQEAIFDFERTTGVVATIKGESGSKSGELAEALSGDKEDRRLHHPDLPVCPAKLCRSWQLRRANALPCIADEAHSSQTGEAAAKLKAVLSAEELKECEDGGEVSTEDMLAAQMAARANDDRHHLCGVHRDAQGQDAGVVWPRPNPDSAGWPENLPAAVPRLFHAAGDRGRLHPRRAAELHAIQAGLQAGAQREGVRTTRRWSAAKP